MMNTCELEMHVYMRKRQPRNCAIWVALDHFPNYQSKANQIFFSVRSLPNLYFTSISLVPYIARACTSHRSSLYSTSLLERPREKRPAAHENIVYRCVP